jgi:hypothetical protein
MIPFLFVGGIGPKVALIVGFTAAELMMQHWNSKKDSREIYIFGRRVHHGEIGALMSVFSLLLGKVPIPAAALGILTGIGAGLMKDDLADIKEWFRFKKMNLKRKVSKKFN